MNNLIEKKYILDVCCGPKSFWFNKHQKNTIYLDRRIEKRGFVPSRPNMTIKPDILSDFRRIPFKDNVFKLIVIDPPHIDSCGDLFEMGMKYGKLDKQNWWQDIRDGINECWRVLEPLGILIFKWNETSIKKKEILNAIGREPLFGHPVLSKIPTHWFTFMKLEDE